MKLSNILIGELSIKRIIRSILLVYLIVMGVGIYFSERLIFPYRQCSYTQHLPGLKMLTSSDGIQIATRYTKSQQEQYLALYFHGNGEDLGHFSMIAEILAKAGISTLSMDYRAYGLSGGEPTETSTYADAGLLYDTAIKMGYDPNRIIIWGRSVGSGPAVELARQREAIALVLDSPFCTAFRVLTVVPIVPFDRFNNLSKIDDVNEALFIIHGEQDKTIPKWHSKKLLDAHTGQKMRHTVPKAGHNTLWSYDLSDVLHSLNIFLSQASDSVGLNEVNEGQ